MFTWLKVAWSLLPALVELLGKGADLLSAYQKRKAAEAIEAKRAETYRKIDAAIDERKGPNA